MTSMGTAVRTGLDTYDLSAVLPDGRLGSVPSGSNVLVTGPPMVGKDRLVLSTLGDGQRRGQPALVVTSDKNAKNLLTQYEQVVDSVDSKTLYVVDCSGTGGGSLEETENVKYVSSPSDLTGVGMGIAKCTREIGERAEQGLRFGLISLSTLLQYASEERVFNFAHVMTGRVATAGYLGLWTLNTTSHDEKTVSTMRAQFDYVVELRETDAGNREMRVLGGEDEWRTWKPL